MKKVITILIIFLVIILVALGIWYFFFQPTTNPDGTTSGFSLRDFIPFGGGTATTTTNPDNGGALGAQNNTPANSDFSKQILRQLTTEPVAGVDFTTTERSVRYVERATGHIFEVPVASGAYRISNKTIPKIYEAFFANGGSDVILRYLDDSEEQVTSLRLSLKEQQSCGVVFNKELKVGATDPQVLALQKILNSDIATKIAESGTGSPGQETAYFGNLTKEAVVRFQEKYTSLILAPQGITTGSGIVDGLTQTKLNLICNPTPTAGEEQLLNSTSSFLAKNINSMSVSSDGKSVFYLQEDAGSRGTVLNLTKGSLTEIFSSPIREWIGQWVNPNTITLTTKPSNGIPGYMYTLNPNTGATEKVLSDVNGLTTLMNPDGERVLLAQNNNIASLFLYNIKSGEKTALPFRTLLEKCVWDKTNTDLLVCAIPNNMSSGTYPDLWYQGQVSFSDDIYKIDTGTGEQTRLIELGEQAGQPIDVSEMHLNNSDTYLTFIDKNTLTPWLLKLQ